MHAVKIDQNIIEHIKSLPLVFNTKIVEPREPH